MTICRSREPTPSWYARRDEQAELLEQAVAAGLDGMIRRLRDRQKLDELRVIELLFYAQLRNKEVAAACDLDEKQVALIKFRALAQVRDHLAAHARLPSLQLDALRLTDWETRRRRRRLDPHPRLGNAASHLSQAQHARPLPPANARAVLAARTSSSTSSASAAASARPI